MKYSDFFLFLLQLSTGLFITPLSTRLRYIHYSGSFANVVTPENIGFLEFIILRRMIMTYDFSYNLGKMINSWLIK